MRKKQEFWSFSCGTPASTKGIIHRSGFNSSALLVVRERFALVILLGNCCAWNSSYIEHKTSPSTSLHPPVCLHVLGDLPEWWSTLKGETLLRLKPTKATAAKSSGNWGMVTRGFIARYKQVEGAKCQEKLVLYLC